MNQQFKLGHYPDFEWPGLLKYLFYRCYRQSIHSRGVNGWGWGLFWSGGGQVRVGKEGNSDVSRGRCPGCMGRAVGALPTLARDAHEDGAPGYGLVWRAEGRRAPMRPWGPTA